MKYYLTIILSLIFITSFSQIQYTFKEEFEDNQNSWVTNNTEKYKTEIIDGHYVMNKKDLNGSRNFTIYHFLNTNEDWEIETELTQLEGPINTGFAFLFGKGVGSNFYIFQIASDGHFRLGKFTSGKFSGISNWIKDTSINSLGKPNEIRVSKIKDKVLFYINNKKVLEHENLKIFGCNHGFFLENKMKIQANYIRFRGPRQKINLVEDSNLPLEKLSLGNKINTPYDEVSPVVSPNGKELYFVSKKNPKNIGKLNKEDAWVSYKKNGVWGNAVQLPQPINNDDNNSVRGVSSGGNTLLLNNEYHKTYMSKGLSITHKTKKGWSYPKNLVIENYKNLNKTSSSSISTSSKIMILSVNGNNSFGDNDLYVCFNKKGRQWSEPINLGKTINTFGIEMAPYLASDNKTLYFSSNGHPGYGGKDIFVTHRLDDSWKNWSTPKNLGPYINSKKNESYFTIEASGEYAYLVSSLNSIGKGDIFQIKLKEDMKPEPVILLKGYVKNLKSKKPIEAPITLHNLESDEEIGQVFSDPTTGYYEMILPQGTEYSIYSEKSGYYAVREQFLVDKLEKYQEIEQDLFLIPIKVGESIKLNNIFFVQSKSVILPKSLPELNNLVILLNDNPHLRIKIEGHTENLGNRDLNIELSKQRAKAVKEYLVSKGISKKRLDTMGYGPDKPITKSSDPNERRKNRRVEFIILSSK